MIRRTSPADPSITYRKAFPGSAKVYVDGRFGVRVPMREIALVGGEPPLRVYDPSGPQGSESDAGLPALRATWIMERDVERVSEPDSSEGGLIPRSLRRQVYRGRGAVTQLHYARRGEITPEMEFVALREGLPAEFVRQRGRAGPGHHPRQHQPSRARADGHRPQLPREDQRQHRELGGASSSIEEEVEKLRWATLWGADTVMDLSTGKNIHETRQWIIRNSAVPIGTVPIYQALEKVGGVAEDLTWEVYRDTLIEQAEQGVDYFTVHAGVLLPLHPAHRRPGDRHRLPRRVDHGQVVPGPSPGELPLYPLPRDLRDHGGVRRLLLAGRRAPPRLDRRCERRGAVRRAQDPG